MRKRRRRREGEGGGDLLGCSPRIGASSVRRDIHKNDSFDVLGNLGLFPINLERKNEKGRRVEERRGFGKMKKRERKREEEETYVESDYLVELGVRDDRVLHSDASIPSKIHQFAHLKSTGSYSERRRRRRRRRRRKKRTTTKK